MPKRTSSLNEVLERLEGGRADLLGRRLRREVLHLARERVATLAGRDRLLLDRLELEEAGDHELAGTARAKLLLDQIRQSLKDLTDALLVELRVLSNVRDNLSLGHALRSSHMHILLSNFATSIVAWS